MIPCLCGCVIAFGWNRARLRIEWIRTWACTRHYTQPYHPTPAGM